MCSGMVVKPGMMLTGVDPNARAALKHADRRGRQPQRLVIEAQEEIAAGAAAIPLHRAGGEIHEELANPGIQRRE
jgi:hypothetical protein